MKNALKDGIYHDLPIAEYHEDSAVGSSSIKTLAKKTPLHLKGMTFKESAAFDFGSALHLSILEPHYAERIVRGPDDRRGKKWTDVKDSLPENHILLTSGDYDEVMAARDSILGNSFAASLLTGNVQPEVSVFHTENDLRCKIRPDMFNADGNVIIDLKTTVSADPYNFAKSVADYSYHIQAAYYERIWESFHGKKLDGFYFIAVEKTEPYAVAVYQLDEMAMQEGRNMVDKYLQVYRDCKDKNEWHGYPEKVNTLRLPTWAFQTIDVSGEKNVQ